MDSWKRLPLTAVLEVFVSGHDRKLTKEYEAKVRELNAKIGNLMIEWDIGNNILAFPIAVSVSLRGPYDPPPNWR